MPVDLNDHRYGALWRAYHHHKENLRISAKRETHMTLQGREETGWVVNGRAHGGDYLGVIFGSKALAEAYIDSVRDGVMPSRAV